MEQVPAIAQGVLKHGDRAVDFVARRFEELHAAGGDGGVIPGGVVGVQKQKDPPAGLVTDGDQLRGGRGASEQQFAAV